MLHTEEGKQMETKLERIAEVAKEKPDEKFTALIHLINKQSLIECHKEMASNKAAGIDKVSKSEYEENLEENIENLLVRMKKQSYKPLPVRRVYIPKGTNGQRPLGIISYEDKLVQRATAKVLNAIYEQDFLECSFGYRPGRNAHDALNVLDKTLNRKRVNYVVDTDIKSFFDTMSHEWLMKFLEHRIADKKLLKLINRMLIAGIMEGGKYEESTIGAIQGGSLSPVLANLYLHYVLDIWFEEVVRKQCRGEAYMVRFADDTVFCFEQKEEAYRFHKAFIKRLGKFGLEVAEEKTKIVELKRDKDEDGHKPSFDFLGFTHYRMIASNGWQYIGRRTSRKKFVQSLKKVKEWMKSNRVMPVRVFMAKLNRKLIGYCNYYAINGNTKKVKDFLDKCRSMVFKWLNRRSQKRSFDWSRFILFMKKYPLPHGRIRVKLFESEVGINYLM